MSEQLFVRLSADPLAAIPWLVWSSSEKEVIASGELSDASQLVSLQDKQQQRPLQILVSAADLLITPLELPRSAQRSWQQVAVFMLEEQLAQAPEDLHVALLGKTGNQMMFAVLDHQLMTRWQGWLEDAGLESSSWQVDALCLPQPDSGQLSALQLGQQWLLRDAQGRALAVDQSWLDSAIAALADEQALQQAAESDPSEGEEDESDQLQADEVSDTLVVRHYSSAPASKPAGVQWQAETPELAMQLLAEGARAYSHNLLQGIYRSEGALTKLWRQWRKVAVAAGVCFVMALGQQGAQWYVAKQQADQLQEQIREVYQRVFPDVQRVRDGRIRGDFRRALAQLEQGDEQAFFAMMNHVGSEIAKIDDFSPRSMRFEQNKQEIRLQAQAKEFQHFEQLRQALAPLETEQGTLNSTDQGVNGSLVIRRQP
ncbi:type II secretion system protein GspL [Aliagarivorans taiwanensis]|uniref:type II secretion system protein GspL n=1 Tax=Aliagarivorans taiwanensis TaxID=561966 RepID=UPI00040ACACF|nr:type II secretion system protein GspL [Aliagarivorans taiwanensis]